MQPGEHGGRVSFAHLAVLAGELRVPHGVGGAGVVCEGDVADVLAPHVQAPRLPCAEHAAGAQGGGGARGVAGHVGHRGPHHRARAQLGPRGGAVEGAEGGQELEVGLAVVAVDAGEEACGAGGVREHHVGQVVRCGAEAPGAAAAAVLRGADHGRDGGLVRDKVGVLDAKGAVPAGAFDQAVRPAGHVVREPVHKARAVAKDAALDVGGAAVGKVLGRLPVQVDVVVDADVVQELHVAELVPGKGSSILD